MVSNCHAFYFVVQEALEGGRRVINSSPVSPVSTVTVKTEQPSKPFEHLLIVFLFESIVELNFNFTQHLGLFKLAYMFSPPNVCPCSLKSGVGKLILRAAYGPRATV